MAIILYNNGIIEEVKPKKHTFTDKEILGLFDENYKLRSKRIVEIPNTWCLWAEGVQDQEEYSKIASDIIGADIYSELVFIHDSEIDPNWTLTDEIIYKDYDSFNSDIILYLDNIAQKTLDENKEMMQVKNEAGENKDNLVFLETIGPTEDKKVLFILNPEQQTKEFFKTENFEQFANKVKDYLLNEYEIQDSLYIYENKKVCIKIKDRHVDLIVRKLINFFQDKEEYEVCKELKDLYDNWKEYKKEKRIQDKKDKKDKKNKKDKGDKKNGNKNNNKL